MSRTGSRGRIVVAGCGAISHLWLDAVIERADLEVVGLVDPMEAATSAVKSRYSLPCPTFPSIEEALDGVDVDIVFNLAVPGAHAAVTSAALGRGCDVFVEKPLATSVDEGRALIAAADAAGRRVSVMQQRRYSAGIRDMRAALVAGLIGRPGIFAVDFFRAPHFGGFREEMEHPLLMDMAIHTFDQARFLSGVDAAAATCLEFNPPGSWFRGNAASICTFEMRDGSVFTYRGSWAAEGLPTSWEGAWRVSGAAGSATWDGSSRPQLNVVAQTEGFERGSSQSEVSAQWQGADGHAGALTAMLEAHATGRPAETDAHDNIRSLSMVLAAIESSNRGGARVEISA